MSRNNLHNRTKPQPWMYPSFVEAREPLAYRAGVHAGRAVKKAKPHLKNASVAAKAAPAEVRTAAQDTVDTIKIQGVLTAIKALDTYDAAKPHIQRKKNAAREKAIDHIATGIDKGLRAKERATGALDKLRYRRDRAADFITVTAGRSMMARVVGVQEVKPKKVKEPHVPLRQVLGKPPKATKQPKAPKPPKQRHTQPVPNPLEAVLDGTRPRRQAPRFAGTAATIMALSALAQILTLPSGNESVAQEKGPTDAPVIYTEVMPERPGSLMDSSLPSTWAAPRAEDRVVYNALPAPSINAVDYAARIELQRAAAAEQARYDQYEIDRARTLTATARTPYVSSPDQASTYTAASRAELDEIRRIAEAAQEQAEMQQYIAERARRVGELQPGQQIGTIRLVQTGEAPAVGAPTGTRIVEHPVMVGMYDPRVLSGPVPTAQEVDTGANDTLDYGGVIQVFGGSVPGIDTKNSPYNKSPKVVTLHHLTPLQPAEGTASTNPTEGLRWPEKTTIADPATGVRGDTLIFTVGDEMQIYEAIDRQIVDTKAPNHAEETRLIYGTEVYDESIFRVVTCYQSAEELSRATPGDIPAADDRYVTYFRQIGTLDLDSMASMIPQ